MKKRVLFIVNVDWFFLSHRLPVALEAQRLGHEVHVATGITDKLAELQSYGFSVHPLSLARGRAGLVRELGAFCQIHALMRKLRPDLVHLVTIKPVLFGGIAARLAGIPVVAAISGLGFVHVAKGPVAAIKKRLVRWLYRIALERSSVIVICQNPNDRDYLQRIVKLPPACFMLLRGSGADLGIFAPAPLPDGAPVVVMACRLLADKGVWEFATAARLVRSANAAVRFCLAGSIDPDNPASLTEADLQKIRSEGHVELLGQRGDMQQLFAGAHMAVLPSYYGEGLPKVLIEAAACGRAVITTDMPGCRDAIEPGVTGLLVPARDAAALASAIAQLAADPARCEAMGRAGRRLAESQFDIVHIVKQHMQIYDALLKITERKSL